jgi:hypothetical protein
MIGDLNDGWTVAQTMLVYEAAPARSSPVPSNPGIWHPTSWPWRVRSGVCRIRSSGS